MTIKVTRTTRRAAATRAAIVDAAEELLASGGPDAVTLEGIAERADVAVQTVYNRVGGRAAVLIAVAERALEDNRTYMDDAYAAPGTPAERIRAASAAYVRFAAERPHQFRLLAEPPDEPAALERVAALVDEQNAKLAAALADGVADGSLAADLDPVTTATALWAAMNGVLGLSWRADRLRADASQLTELVTAVERVVLRGLLAR
ncbi:TetR/AcrR family transcriptional regulator [Streptomyces sp. NPDC059875]|uniref:TetR/AcrR family transcriptional regulator n=1 Tax=Streptomyces camelliae TaxID=3004093 RepID=A0ABY7PE36_9ACTN|nr:TetR/AcrR family transcriptional regulator [Streptomyces sp. HUAS 2-6]WBO68888.1 TetR/AcrR family transcriptional regulator [Streptomyces sp. HUAS 2-6]